MEAVRKVGCHRGGLWIFLDRTGEQARIVLPSHESFFIAPTAISRAKKEKATLKKAQRGSVLGSPTVTNSAKTAKSIPIPPRATTVRLLNRLSNLSLFSLLLLSILSMSFLKFSSFSVTKVASALFRVGYS